MVISLPLISPVVLLLNDVSSSSIMEEELTSFNSNTTDDINGRGTTFV
jgi:hypothetical protein